MWLYCRRLLWIINEFLYQYTLCNQQPTKKLNKKSLSPQTPSTGAFVCRAINHHHTATSIRSIDGFKDVVMLSLIARHASHSTCKYYNRHYKTFAAQLGERNKNATQKIHLNSELFIVVSTFQYLYEIFISIL